MAKVSELLKVFNKNLAEGVVSYGNTVQDCVRLPTDIFSLDVIMGGGFPKGRMSILYGVESSNKTNVVLLAIASSQKLHPNEVCVFVDLEGSFDAAWATKLGIDTEKLLVVHPDFAEEAIDIIDALLQTEDIGVIGVDSLSAMMTANEGDSSAEKVAVGGASGIIGKFMRKANKNLLVARREGRSPTLLCISQTRSKIGVMFGNPETFSGGNAPRFYANMILRLYGKDIINKQVHPNRPCIKETSVSIKKFKVPITGTTCSFELIVLPHDGLTVGQCNDKPAITSYLKEFGWLSKTDDGKSWQLLGEEFRTQRDCMNQIFGDERNLRKIKSAIMDKVLDDIENIGVE